MPANHIDKEIFRQAMRHVDRHAKVSKYTSVSRPIDREDDRDFYCRSELTVSTHHDAKPPPKPFSG